MEFTGGTAARRDKIPEKVPGSGVPETLEMNRGGSRAMEVLGEGPVVALVFRGARDGPPLAAAGGGRPRRMRSGRDRRRASWRSQGPSREKTEQP
jgi:hypothetical protein